MVPKSWLQQIAPGATLTIAFGGSGAAPSSPVFTQVLPLLDPLHDVSLTTRKPFPSKVFAPFLDPTLYPTPNLPAISDATRQMFFALAFITADPKNQPAWGGLPALGLQYQYYVDQVSLSVLSCAVLCCPVLLCAIFTLSKCARRFARCDLRAAMSSSRLVVQLGRSWRR